MGLLTLEHGKLAYRADFALYAAAVVFLAALLLLAGPGGRRLAIAGLALAGLAGWTAIEYALHRFVLHGLPPFRRWHAEHHHRPKALICAPTIVSAASIATLVTLPAWLLGDLWYACALTFGVLTGYLAYAITHHATHHWRADNAWLKRRKHWHALHHHAGAAACYGVTSSFWDRMFGTARRAPAGAARRQ